MADIFYKQTLTVLAGKNPTVSGAPVTQKDFEISPAESLELSDMNESVSGRFKIATSVSDQSIGMGTVALGKLLIFKPEADMKIKLVNGAGTSQLITMKGGRTSIIHAEFTNVLLTNDGAAEVKGVFYVAGD